MGRRGGLHHIACKAQRGTPGAGDTLDASSLPLGTSCWSAEGGTNPPPPPAAFCRLNKARTAAENNTAKHADLVKVSPTGDGACFAIHESWAAGSLPCHRMLAEAPWPGSGQTLEALRRAVHGRACHRTLWRAGSWLQVTEMMKKNLEQEIQGYRGELAKQEQARGCWRSGSGRRAGPCLPHALFSASCSPASEVMFVQHVLCCR